MQRTEAILKNKPDQLKIKKQKQMKKTKNIKNFEDQYNTQKKITSETKDFKKY